MRQTIRTFLLILFAILLGLLVLPSAQVMTTVTAQTFNGNDVVWAMNDVRALYGLAPYELRDDLMSLAQQHAEYMAENEILTHVRADGSQPNVTAENISLGPIQIAINTWMDDQPHKDTILAWSSGWAGAGVAKGENGYVYISFDMIRKPDAKFVQIFDPYPPQDDESITGGTSGGTTQTASGSNATPAAYEYVYKVITATPDERGYILHSVKNGQSLWSIAVAYDTTIDTIVGLNNLDADDPTIYTGQRLLVRIVPTQLPGTKQTATTTMTAAAASTATRTPSPTVTARKQSTMTPTTAATDITVTVIPPETENARLSMSTVFLIIGGIGLLGIVGVTLYQRRQVE
ncbi:MAG: LysM peptidoglycan-binding domain-containing protein [Anaerolineaceae bacterium]|nr:LysM peptidoglycan-binding domain-containing protein [Anaerolineaceae bacterium]